MPRPTIRHRLPALLLGVLALLAIPTAAPAGAASVTTTNACHWSIDDYWRDLGLTLAGGAAPSPVGPGGGLQLGGASVAARLPDWIPEYGYNLGLLRAGRNDLPSRVWVAIAGDGTAQGTQVREVSVTASTTISVDGDQSFVSATPLDVAIPLPATDWTAAASGTAAFRQAGAGTLPALPIGLGGAAVVPRGSIVIHTTLGANVRLVLDCVPGTATNGGRAHVEQAAQPFDAVAIQAGAVVPPPPPAPVAPAIRSRRLQATTRAVPVAVACPAGGAVCEGVARVRVHGSRRLPLRRPRTLAERAYRVAAGKRVALRLPLTDAGARLLRKHERLGVRLSLVPPKPARAVVRRLALRTAPSWRAALRRVR
jgi:hypothetical protein